MECEICLEDFQATGNKIPRILHGCGHTFCDECLGKMTTPLNLHMIIKCPFDRIPTALANGTSCLKKNFYILQKLNEPRQAAAQTLPKFTGLACPTHPAHPALLFCKSTTCYAASSLMCSECVTNGPHKNHVHTSLDEEKRSRKRKLEENEAEIHAETVRFTKIMKMCDEAFNSYNGNVLEDYKKASDKKFEEIRENAWKWYESYSRNIDELENEMNERMEIEFKKVQQVEGLTLKNNCKEAVRNINQCMMNVIDMKKLPDADLCKLQGSALAVKFLAVDPSVVPSELMIPNMPDLPELPHLNKPKLRLTKQFHIHEIDKNSFIMTWITIATNVINTNDYYICFEYKNAKAVLWKIVKEQQTPDFRTNVFIANQETELEDLRETLKSLKQSEVIVAVDMKNLSKPKKQSYTAIGRKKNTTCYFYENAEQLVEKLLFD